jgi:hypothetical protein
MFLDTISNAVGSIENAVLKELIINPSTLTVVSYYPCHGVWIVKHLSRIAIDQSDREAVEHEKFKRWQLEFVLRTLKDDPRRRWFVYASNWLE